MNRLLIDIGNSNIKTAYGSGKEISGVISYGYKKENILLEIARIIKQQKKEFDEIGISCLNNKFKKEIEKIICTKYSIKPFFVKVEKNLPIKIDYEKTLGSDRICSTTAAAIKNSKKKNILVIDFGTATTYNLISNRVFIGGLITPGIATALHSLNTRANLPLPEIRGKINLITNKTNNNILSGVIHQSLFTTEGIIKNLKSEYKNLFVVSTGGLSELIYKKSCLINKNEKHLVLEGINFILNFRKKSTDVFK